MERNPDLYRRILDLRAIREYRTEAVSDDDLAAVIEAGRWTGTSKNRQGWSVVVVREAAQQDLLASCGDFTDPVRRAPVTLVLVKEDDGNEFDVGRVAQNMMLAASALGVASCPITLHRSEAAREVLGVPDGKTTRYAIALGYPADEARPTRMGGRKPAGEFVHNERYSSS